MDRWGWMRARSGVTGSIFAGMGRLRISLASSASLWSRRLSRQGLRCRQMFLVTKTFVAGATSKLSSKPKPVAAKISAKVADGIENCTFAELLWQHAFCR